MDNMEHATTKGNDMSEQPHTPTTDEVRLKYESASLGQSASAEFDRWLDKVKADARREGQADAWDEGNRASRIMLPVDPPRYPTNPYRQEATR